MKFMRIIDNLHYIKFIKFLKFINNYYLIEFLHQKVNGTGSWQLPSRCLQGRHG